MTHEEFQNKIKSIPNFELAKNAEQALRKLCSTYGTGFKMSVPPRLDDTDIVFSELIERFKLNIMQNLVGYWFLDENQQEVTVVHIWDKWCIVENAWEEEPYILPLDYVQQIKKDSDEFGNDV